MRVWQRDRLVDGQCTIYDFLEHFDMDGHRIDKVIVKKITE